MKWQKIYETLKRYDDENRKGWYSYTWANHSVDVARATDPETLYILDLYDYGRPSNSARIERLRVNEDGKKYWDWTGERVNFSDLPDTDDYYIEYDVFHPYIAMVKIISIKEDNVHPDTYIHWKDMTYRRAREVNEKVLNLRALNGIKQYIDKQDCLCYNKRHYNYNANEYVDIDCEYCAWCGMGENSYSLAEFHYNKDEYSICTNGSLIKENKHRKHFGEREWLFPFTSNGWDSHECLYIQTSSLSLEASKKGLRQRKERIITDLKKIFDRAGILEYELVEIRRQFKYQK